MAANRTPEICQKFGARAQADLGYTRKKVAGLFGNGDIESQGYNTLQEINPVVAGSAGGFGWMQWTGPRRRAYLAWASALGLDPSADETNYRYMVHELLTIETAAHRAILACADDEAVAATVVCTKYLRPGTPHLDKRIASARRNLAYVPETVVVKAPAPTIQPGEWAEDNLSEFEIKAVQQRLLDLGYHVVGFVDGKWGKRTKAALIALQTQAGITPDGHYGPQTRAALSSDANKAVVSEARANVTANSLAKAGNPTVKAGRKITLASAGAILAGVGTLGGALAAGWTTELPWPFSMLTGFLPPWALPVLVVAFNLYTAAKSTGLIGSAVERVREGIDNTGAAQQAPTPVALPFGLGKLFGQP